MADFLFLSGSIRQESFNQTLFLLACQIANKQNVTAKHINLQEYDMPLYNQNIERQGFPEKTISLYNKFVTCKEFFIVTPKYNAFFSPLLANTIHWLSRTIKQNTSAFQNKAVVITACSLGNLGGIRYLAPLRLFLSNLGVLAPPNQLSISAAHMAFIEQGILHNKKQTIQLESVITSLVQKV